MGRVLVAADDPVIAEFKRRVLAVPGYLPYSAADA